MTAGINFTSAKNYMKRDASSGTQSVAAPVTSAFGGLNFITTTTIAHNLGSIPFFRLYYEPFKDGIVWPGLGSRGAASATNPTNTAQTGPYLIGWADSTNLTLELGYFTNGLTGTYTIYYVIYKDYAH